jgi:Myosin-like coiled-coil protein
MYYTALLEQQRRDQEMESSKSDQLTKQVSTFSQTETELRSQLNIYVEKFKQVCSTLSNFADFQVEDTLNSSNDLFLTFRKEMEEMSKKTKRLEKENSSLVKKHDAMNQSIIKMAEDRAKYQKETELLQKKNSSLEKLCRGMQAQGRGQAVMSIQEQDDTESEYDYEDEEEDSEDEESDDYDEDSDEVPPPKASTTDQSSTKVAINTQIPNRIKSRGSK